MLPAPSNQTRPAAFVSSFSVVGSNTGARTPNLKPRTGGVFILARPAGFEPTTSGFGGQHSIQLSYGRNLVSNHRRQQPSLVHPPARHPCLAFARPKPCFGFFALTQPSYGRNKSVLYNLGSVHPLWWDEQSKHPCLAVRWREPVLRVFPPACPCPADGGLGSRGSGPRHYIRSGVFTDPHTL